MFRVALVVLAVAACALPAIARTACHAPRGTHVTLFGGVDDPDVLVWDSKDRLVRYSGGSADTRQFLLPHALLGRPGTKAVVVSCSTGAVHPKFGAQDADAVGVMILSGKYRGRYGWVSSGDVHGAGVLEARDAW
ncbi:MAG TPA: hypothetical protein VFL13_05865 [Candidatus Baltobacteraceae bacterium]|nr:hypothetical protein [Candidatus Baltobacteraceae bacterium]